MSTQCGVKEDGTPRVVRPFKTDKGEEHCRWLIQNHLHISPYHKLDEAEAMASSWSVEVESWTEEDAQWAKWQTDNDARSWKRSRLNPAVGGESWDYTNTPAAQAAPMSAAESMVALRSMPTGHSMSAFSAAGDGPGPAITLRPDQSVTMSGVKCQALLDSIKRSRHAVCMCLAVAQRSVASFEMERDTLLQCETVLASWVATQAAQEEAQSLIYAVPKGKGKGKGKP